MGLDMYLERFPRYKNYGPEKICNYEEWLAWKDDPKAKGHSFEEWCGGNEKILPNAKDGEYLASFFKTRYYHWDDDHRYPHESVRDHVAYWRKANAVHKWFVDNVQDGVDDCEYHSEVRKDQLAELVSICEEILKNAVLAKGKVQNGWNFKNGKEVPNYEEGLTVINPEVCEDLLPTQSGFFFGSTGYDQYYMEDIRKTYEMCKKALDETDFEKQMLFYRSSW